MSSLPVRKGRLNGIKLAIGIDTGRLRRNRRIWQAGSGAEEGFPAGLQQPGWEAKIQRTIPPAPRRIIRAATRAVFIEVVLGIGPAGGGDGVEDLPTGEKSLP